MDLKWLLVIFGGLCLWSKQQQAQSQTPYITEPGGAGPTITTAPAESMPMPTPSPGVMPFYEAQAAPTPTAIVPSRTRAEILAILINSWYGHNALSIDGITYNIQKMRAAAEAEGVIPEAWLCQYLGELTPYIILPGESLPAEPVLPEPLPLYWIFLSPDGTTTRVATLAAPPGIGWTVLRPGPI